MEGKIPPAIATELRIIKRIFGETYKVIKRTGLSNLIIVVTMAAILTIFGCMFKITLSLGSFVSYLGQQLEVSVYLKDNVTPQKVIGQIKLLPSVESITLKPKEQAWEELKTQYNVANIDNPLPNTLHIRVKSYQDLDETSKIIGKMEGVEETRYASWLANKIRQISNVAGVITVIVVILLGMLTLFIINNTVYLLIQWRSQEIEIMRIMGVSNWYIKSPYILQGAFYGLIGSLIAILPLRLLENYINKLLLAFHVFLLDENTNIVLLTIIVIGVVVGAGGSMFSVRKYLKI